MNPILDSQGNPLPASGRTADILDQLIEMFDRNPEAWGKMEGRFNELCGLLEPRAAQLRGIVAGAATIDSSIEAGRVLARMLADVVMMCLLMKRKDDTEKAKEVDRSAGNGEAPILQMPAPKVTEEEKDERGNIPPAE